MNISRRQFNKGIGSLAFSGLAASMLACRTKTPIATVPAYGSLIRDPDNILDLPEGFSYRVISEFGKTMSDGYRVPDSADGMGCIDLGNGRCALIRNHELKPEEIKLGALAAQHNNMPPHFDSRLDGSILPGGTTTLIYDTTTQTLSDEYLSLIGTIRNCSGGITPWGTWLSCEESTTLAGAGVKQDHGWVFEVSPQTKGVDGEATQALKAMGRFNHEAAAVDPNTGIVYMTEDKDNSVFYRFIPKTYGKLSDGGRLQALAIRHGKPADTRNRAHPHYLRNEWHEVEWIDLDDVESPNDDLRLQGAGKGAAIFARAEGIFWGENELYFCCTSGGAASLGQIMRYRPSSAEGTIQEAQNPGQLSLFVESTSKDELDSADNLCVAPNGHLIVCEDQYKVYVENHLRGVTPKGQLYDFAFIRKQTEPAGACFSPDGKTLFVNLYSPTLTLAITGPWDSFKEA